MFRNLFAVIAAFLLVDTAAAQPAPKKADDKTLVTKVYDLKPLLGERGKANGIANIDAVIKLILDVVEIGELKPGTTGPQIIERENGKLEVRATEKILEEIKDLLDALERLQDLAVDVKADVIEFDAATFDKLTNAMPKAGKGKPGSAVIFATGEELDENGPTAEDHKAMAEMTKILKSARQVQTSSARFVNGAAATFAARQSVVTYKNMPEPGALPILGKPEGNPLFVKDGFKLVGLPVVSVDRRFIRFKLTEQSVVVAGIKKRELAEVNGQKIIAQTPDLEDVGTTGSTTVADGGTVLFKLAYAPKDKVWVVVLHPTIFIQAEEDILKKEKEAKK